MLLEQSQLLRAQARVSALRATVEESIYNRVLAERLLGVVVGYLIFTQAMVLPPALADLVAL